MKQFLFLLLLLGGLATAFGQDSKTVVGTVSNTAGQPLPGVTVRSKNGKIALTSVKGIYKIKTETNDILTFSYVGYEKVSRTVGDKGVIDVVMKEENNSMNDVVVIGYGTTKRKDLTGAVSSVSGKELAKIPVQNVVQALQGQLAGVQVSMPDGTPGAEPTVTLRGGTSISQDNTPLYVVDGVPQPDGVGYLDPTDIESIDVLKDGAANIYGARGANGVINITTKQLKAGKLRLSYDNYVGFQKVTRTIPMMMAYDYALLEYEQAVANTTKMAAFINNYGPFDSLEYNYAGKGVNWQDEIFGHPVSSQYHKVGISGGNSETQYNFFFSRNDGNGVMKNSGSIKNVFKLGLNHNAGKNVKISANINYSDQDVTGMGTQDLLGSNSQYNALQNILRYRPTMGIRGTDDAFLQLDDDPLLDGTANDDIFQNPIVAAKNQLKDNRAKLLNANATLNYSFLSHFVYRGVVSYKDGNTKLKTFNTAQSAISRRNGGPFGSMSQKNISGWDYNNTITYSNTFNSKHKVDITLGQEQLYDYDEIWAVNVSQFPNVNLGWNDLGLAGLSGIPTSYAENSKMLSFFGRANYALNDKYLFTALFRADGSSKFAPKNQWGYFPTFLASWKIINENFLKDSKLFSDLKLRASWGYSGNNRVANYLSNQMFNSGNYPLDDVNTGTAYQNTLPNPDLKWETNIKTNIGLDIGLLNQRITVTADYYDNRSKNLLYNVAITQTSGYTNQLRNIGQTSSRGLELTITSSNIRSKELTWNTSFNITFPKTKVISLNGTSTSILANTFANANDYILQVGKPIGSMYGWVYDGLYTVDDFNYDASAQAYTLKNGVPVDATVSAQPGYLKLKDLNGDGVINDADRTIIGNAQPKFFGGLNNTFSYKGFDLSILVNWVYGNDIYNGNMLFNSSLANDYYNGFAYQTKRWMTIDASGNRVTDPATLAAMNKGKTIPAWNGGGAANGGERLYDKMIEDGSFLRLNNISLGYTFPRKWIQKIKLSSARIYVTAYNLAVFTKYSGYDPEVSVVNNGGITPGVDFGAYPRSRSFLAGVNIAL